jgi:hypothetical protein
LESLKETFLFVCNYQKKIAKIKYSDKYIIILLISSFVLQYQLNAQGRLGVLLKENSIQCVSTNSGNLYSGIDNYVKISDSIQHEYVDLSLKTSNGIVEKDSNDLFLVIPAKPGQLRLTIIDQENDSSAIGYEYLQVKKVPGPVLMLNNYQIESSAQIPKSLLMDCDSLSIFFTDDLPGSNAWIQITEFTLGYNYGGFHVSFLNPSNHILFETKEIINRLGPEHEISIRVKVKSIGKIIKELPIYRLTIY